MKAGVDAGLQHPVRYLSWRYLTGAVTAIGTSGRQSADRRDGIQREPAGRRKINQRLRNSIWPSRNDHEFDFIAAHWVVMFEMLSRAINEAGSTDALKVALKLEGMQQKDLLGQNGDHAQGRPSVDPAVL